MKKFLALLEAVVACLFLCSFSARAAVDCPSAIKGHGGFVLERGEQSKTEVIFGEGVPTAFVFRLRGTPLLEQQQFEGLIDLERLDRGRKTVFKPKSDLAKLFPLRPKQQISIELEARQEGVDPTLLKLVLKMVGTDSLEIGACRYDVLKFERIETRADKKADSYVEYYSPELKFVVAKEYRERDGRTTLIKFDRIYWADR